MPARATSLGEEVFVSRSTPPNEGVRTPSEDSLDVDRRPRGEHGEQVLSAETNDSESLVWAGGRTFLGSVGSVGGEDANRRPMEEKSSMIMVLIGMDVALNEGRMVLIGLIG